MTVLSFRPSGTTTFGTILAAASILMGCQGILGLNEFSEDPLSAAGGGGDDADGGSGGAAGGQGGSGLTPGPGDTPVPHVTWAAVLSGSGQSAVSRLLVGPDGTVAVCGSFQGALQFGDLGLTAEGETESDIYVARLPGRMKSGEPGPEDPIFLRQFGDAAPQRCSALALKADDSILMTGALEGNVAFDHFELTNSGPPRAFVAELDAAGQVTEAFQPGGTGHREGLAIASFGADAGVLLAGKFNQSLTAAGASLDTGELFAAFAARVSSSSGEWLYGVGDAPPGDTTEQAITAADLAADGSAILVGTYAGQASTTQGRMLDPQGGTDVFVVKLDPAGEEQWVVEVGGPQDDHATAVTVDDSGGIIVVGSFAERLAAREQSVTGTAPDDLDAFALKLGPDGQVHWLKALKGVGTQEAWDVTVDGADNVYVVGSFSGSIEFDRDTLGANEVDGFFAVLSKEGDERFGTSFTGPGEVAVRAAAADPTTGGVVVGVEFSGWVDMTTRSFEGNGESTDVCLARVDWLK